MWPTARYVTAVNDDRLGSAFHADRAAMRGHAAPTASELAASIPYQREQCRLMLGWLDVILRRRDFLLGDTPGLADFAVYQRIWWLGASVAARATCSTASHLCSAGASVSAPSGTGSAAR